MEVADPRCEPEPVYDATHFSADVQAALAQLPPDTRRALLLSEVGGYSYEQIAQQLGVKEGTVASRIHRARARLRQSLAHRAPQLVTANAQPAEHAELVSTPTQPLKLPKLTRLPNQKSWSTQLPGRCVGCLPGPQRSTRPKVRQAKPSRTPREPVRPEPGHPGKPRPSTDVPVRKASMRHRRNYLALEPQLTTGQIARVRRAAHRPAGAHLNALPANLLPAVSGRVNAPPEASRRRPAPC
jgi:transposase-like protein